MKIGMLPSVFKESLSIKIGRPSPLREINKFHSNNLSGGISVRGNPPYSILLKNLKYKDEIKIIKELKTNGIITDENQDLYNNSLITRSLLIP